MIKFVVHCFLLLTIIGCVDKSTYSKTFDYKSMKIVKSATVLDKAAGVELIEANDDKIIINVILRGKKTKRIFEKKNGFWYSELNYRYNPVKGTGQELYEVHQKYYIYPTYIIKEFDSSSGYKSLVYLNLSKNEIYHFNDLNKDNFSLETALLNDYNKDIYIIKNSELIKKGIRYTKGVEDGKSTEVVLGYSGNDPFFLFDLEVYNIGDNSSGYMEIF